MNRPITIEYNSALDVIRGIAIILVVCYHVFPCLGFFDFGWLGVDLFFVLSGFLITNILLISKNETDFFQKFYLRRTFRILPLYFLTLTLFFFIGGIIFDQQSPTSVYYYYNSNQLYFWTFTQNVLFIINGLPAMPYLTHLWSLAIEMQFYLLWPYIIYLIRDEIKLLWFVGFIIIAVITTRCIIYLHYPQKVEFYYFNTITRIDTLLIGSLASLAIRFPHKSNLNISYSFISISLFLFFFILISRGNIYLYDSISATIGYTIFAFLFSSIIYLISINKIRLNLRTKYHKFLIFSGKISYGIYIFHLPVYLIVSTKFTLLPQTFITNQYYSKLTVSFLSIIITYSLSILSYFLFEAPFQRLGKNYFYSVKTN